MAANKQRQESKQRSKPGNEALFDKAVVDLLLKGLELHRRQIRIDAGQGVAGELFEAGIGRLVCTTIAPAYRDMSFSRVSSGSVTAGRCVSGTKYMAWSFQ
jgi:hypothetical protein